MIYSGGSGKAPHNKLLIRQMTSEDKQKLQDIIDRMDIEPADFDTYIEIINYVQDLRAELENILVNY